MKSQKSQQKNKNMIAMDRVPVYHLELVREKMVEYRKATMTDDVAQVLHEVLDKSPVEQFVVVYLNMSGEIMGCEKIAVGGLGQVAVSMKEVFRGAISACVADIVIGHNHPQGACKPSHEDVILTGVAVATGELVGIRVVDHIIVSPNGDYYSIREHERECIDNAAVRITQEKLRRQLAADPLSAIINMMREPL